jgi:hypothetical protein
MHCTTVLDVQSPWFCVSIIEHSVLETGFTTLYCDCVTCLSRSEICNTNVINIASEGDCIV